MMDRSVLSITELTDAVLDQMKASGYKESTRKNYSMFFNKLCRMAEERGERQYTIDLGSAFTKDDSHIIPENTKRYCHERTSSYIRCIRFIESFLATGQVDWSPARYSAEYHIDSEILQERFSAFLEELKKRRLKPNTVDGYRRFIRYFIEYIENKGYLKLSDIRKGDIVTFIAFICNEKYQPTSLGACMPGLKIFLGMNSCTEHLLCEIPEHLPKKRDILKVYSDEEYEKIITYMDLSANISFRNKAITLLALNTGLRAVDICGLKLSDIDWHHECIHIIQEKTAVSHDIPLSEAIGNALVDYLLNERPVTSSQYVFLSTVAPYNPLVSHAGVRGVLFKIVSDSDINPDGRIYGTRITRHSAASRMLRKGIPLHVISDMLGHRNKDSAMVYITTDEARLADCTLPLPKGGVYND